MDREICTRHIGEFVLPLWKHTEHNPALYDANMTGNHMHFIRHAHASRQSVTYTRGYLLVTVLQDGGDLAPMLSEC